MDSSNEGSPPAEDAERVPLKREYVPPKLERLGTIRELTRGQGMSNRFDNTNPPGQNKSVL